MSSPSRRTVQINIGAETRRGRQCKRIFGEAFAHMEKKEWPQAQAGFTQVIASGVTEALFPALANRGICNHFLSRPAQALRDYERAMAIATPVQRRLISLNRGVLYGSLNRLDEALADFEAEGSDEAKFNMAMPYLLRGDYARGLEYYRYRKDVAQWKAHPWRLSELAGKDVAILHEQGLGDSVQMARFVPALIDVARSVTWITRAPLMPLLSQIPGLKLEIADENRAPAVMAKYECRLLVMDLMLTMGLDVDFKVSGKPYLTAEPQRVERMRALLPPGRRIGLAWRGLADHANDHNRSMTLAHLRPLIESQPDTVFVSLQRDLRDGEWINDAGAQLKDFSDTAALLSCLDLLITVDTAPLHVAGAIGLKTFALLPYAPDWRWGQTADRTPWYDSVRLFRQPAYGDWASAVAAAVRCCT